MIDSISLIFLLKEFKSIGGSLMNCRPISSNDKLIKNINNDGQPKIKKEMYLPNPRSGHFLRVTIDEYMRIRIKGSLRKWFYGNTSFKDLSKQHYCKAVEELANSLHISVTDIMNYGRLTHIELGYTIQTKTNPT